MFQRHHVGIYADNRFTLRELGPKARVSAILSGVIKQEIGRLSVISGYVQARGGNIDDVMLRVSGDDILVKVEFDILPAGLRKSVEDLDQLKVSIGLDETLKLQIEPQIAKDAKRWYVNFSHNDVQGSLAETSSVFAQLNLDIREFEGHGEELDPYSSRKPEFFQEVIFESPLGWDPKQLDDALGTLLAEKKLEGRIRRTIIPLDRKAKLWKLRQR
mgnify:CR=1 FL=1